MSLSPYDGECATWLIMCFQNYKFSDDSKEGHGDVTEAGRKKWLTLKHHQQVQNLGGWPWRLALWVVQLATCAIRGPRMETFKIERGDGRGHLLLKCHAFHCLPLNLYLNDLVMLNIIGQLFLALWKESSIFLVNYKKKKVFWVRKGVFGVCLTFYIIIVINKEKNLQHFSDST